MKIRLFISRIVGLRAILSLLMATVLLTACGFHQASENEAQKVADALFAAIKAGDIEKALGYYDKDFFNKYSREDWKARLATVQEKLGALESTRLKESQVSTVFSGRRFIYVYINKYANGNATETLVLVQAVDDEPLLIAAHDIQSLALD